jgi:hypothetical protein
VGAPGVFGKDVILKGVKVLCFDIVLQVFILLGLEAFPVYKLVTSGYGTPERFRGSISGSFWEHKKSANREIGVPRIVSGSVVLYKSNCTG